jgi:hypothetical protein
VDYDNWDDGGENATYDGCPLVIGAGNAYSGCMQTASVGWLLGPPWFGGTTSGSCAVTNSMGAHTGTNSLAVTVTFDGSSNVANFFPECWSGWGFLTSMPVSPAPSAVSTWFYANGPVTIANMELNSGSYGSTQEEIKLSGINFVPTVGAWSNLVVTVNGNGGWVLIQDTGAMGAVQWDNLSGVGWDFVGPANTTVSFAIDDVYFYP